MDTKKSFSIIELREKHPKFIYQNYHWTTDDDDLVIKFSFRIEPDIEFTPSIRISSVSNSKLNNCDTAVINNLVFNLGLVEMISYWKAACPPVIEVRAGHLDEEQIRWWLNLIIKGLGEFFFVNQIDYRSNDFISIRSDAESSEILLDSSSKEKDILVLTSGGKDTALTLSILQNERKSFGSLLLNPTVAADELSFQCGVSETIIVKRNIAPNLLELNESGYLNGHTPFSAYLGFLSVAVAVMFGYKNVLVSNERSSNEGNTTYLDNEVNHQYTKTVEFEEKFRAYVDNYLSSNVLYFSFLRPLYEIQIAAMMTRFDKILSTFKSCNRNYKLNSWCGKCPKCLAVYTLVYPFLESRSVEEIYGTDPFENEDNTGIVVDLVGLGDHKPFECVGTHEETVIGLYLGMQKAKRIHGENLPAVWKFIEDRKILDAYDNLDRKAAEILTDWNAAHCLPAEFENMLKKYFGEFLLKKYAAV